MKKPIKFSVHQLIVNDQEFSVDTFSRIENHTDTDTRHHSDTGELEVIKFNRVTKNIIEDRFVTFYFESADKWPYSTKVVSPDGVEHDNPRTPEEFELEDQFFVVMDVAEQRIYLSDQRKKNTFRRWLAVKLALEVTIKSVIGEAEFVDKLKKVSSIKFTVSPNLFSSGGGSVLSETLVRDIFGFDADKAEVNILYSNKLVNGTIIEKLRAAISNSDSFEEIVVIGRDEEDLETMFNMENVVNKMTIDADIADVSLLFIPESVFTTVIDYLKTHE